MERGSDKHGPRVDDQVQEETESLERSGKESRAEDFVEKEPVDAGPADASSSGHRVAGSGSSAEEYTYKDHGEKGGASHPKPKDADG